MSETPLNTPDLAEARQQLKALGDLIAVLNEDIDCFKKTTDGAGRRALVRSVFAYIEGTSFGFRSAALYLSGVRKVELDIGEILIARETTFALNEKGKVEERLVLSPPLANLRFSLTLFAKAIGASYEFPAGDSNFEQLRKAQQIRNRLTHPRSSVELDVTAEEQDMVIKAAEWVGEEHTKLLKTFAYRLHSGRENFFSKIESLPKTESGGYAVTTLKKIFVEELTASHLIAPEKVEEWFASLFKKQ